MKLNPISIGIDDAQFRFDQKSHKTSLIGVICQGTRMVGTVREPITIDGDDSTQVIINLVKQAEKHVQYILTDTITFAGFNIADISKIHDEINKPIIAVTEREIDLDAVKMALIKRFPTSYNEKLEKIVNAGNLYEMELKTAGGFSTIYLHLKGIKLEEAKDLLIRISIDSKLPECVRMAHLIRKIF